MGDIIPVLYDNWVTLIIPKPNILIESIHSHPMHYALWFLDLSIFSHKNALMMIHCGLRHARQSYTVKLYEADFTLDMQHFDYNVNNNHYWYLVQFDTDSIYTF